MSEEGPSEAQRRRRRHGPRRVTVPGTSGQPEEIESKPWNPLAEEKPLPPADRDARAEELTRDRPPHWG
ncbi:hypothetical protein [Nesterenkonia populi]|uniref:hypothetical protein n=1 Tax=Nesterenkonia populi TaxID=1591087 RepID=UPI0011BFE1D4|nr:hypothetical protein [Nesterenkonia populi]